MLPPLINNNTNMNNIEGFNSSSGCSSSYPTSSSRSTSTTTSRIWIKQSAFPTQKLSFFQQRNASNSKLAPPELTESSCSESSSSISLSRFGLCWGWKEGLLLEQNEKIVKVAVINNNHHSNLNHHPVSDNNNNNNTSSSSLSSSAETTYEFPSSFLKDGMIVLANEKANVDDLIALTHLHEPAVVESLRHRYQQDKIYTFTGAVLLALNPFQTIRGLYGEAMQKKYATTNSNANSTKEPHVYAIADAAFRGMMRGLEDSIADNAYQSILVSGESGSGKTVTTKYVMKYLAALSQRKEERAYVKAQQQQQNVWKQQQQSHQHRDDDTVGTSTTTLDATSIEAQVLQSNPILESFGNARTVRNDNSSRFGKFIEIQFLNTKLVGAQMETYLLEKVRLNRQNNGERNYHVFYELLSNSMPSQSLSQLYLATTAAPTDFKLLSSSTTTTRRDGVTDTETYQQLMNAFQTMQFQSLEIHNIFAITAAILHASNLQFIIVDNNEEQSQIDTHNVHLQPFIQLMGWDNVQQLNQALCQMVITAGASTTVTRSRNVEQATIGLESLLQEIYSALFQYLVQRINQQIASDKYNGTIGVLDIFGFESFTVNSFEQLCINYCNEALQQQFNAFVLKNEQAEYEREGIEWSFIEFPENQDVLDLIEKQSRGCSSILSILDDQCRAPGPSDKAFCLAIYNQCKKLPRFEATRKHQAQMQFAIHHYAGPVEYTVHGFTLKNKDELPKETLDLLRTSTKPIVQQLADIMETSREQATTVSSSVENPTPRKQLHRSDSTVGRPTVAGQFRKQLRVLRQKIDQTSPHYVRCLKPNDMLVPDHFDAAIVAEQLKCGGILEAVRVARAGFTQHYSHADFIRRYRVLAWRELADKSTIPQSPAKQSMSTAAYGGRRSTFVRSGSAPRQSFAVQSYLPAVSSSSSSCSFDKSEKKQLSAAEAKANCKDLIKILYRKIQQHGITLEVPGGSEPAPVETTPSPIAKAKTYTSKSPPPSWSKGKPSRLSTPSFVPPTPPPQQHSARKSVPVIVGSNSAGSPLKESNSPTTGQAKSWKRTILSSSDLAKVGIQMGKTKVFLRHTAFEALECVRGLEQNNAATKLNSIFRRYLARIAYLPYRNAFRSAKGRRLAFEDEYKETKEGDEEYEISSVNRSFLSAHQSFNTSFTGASESLVDKWTESQIKEAIHNPIPRHEWGKTEIDASKFKWVIVNGLWVKNYSLIDHQS